MSDAARFLSCILIFGSTFSPLSGFSQNWDWVTTASGGGSNYVWDIVHDSQNNSIVTGRLKGTVTVGTGASAVLTLPLGVETDIFLAKFDPDGELIWVKRMGGVDPDWGRALAIDSNDNIYLTGDFCNMAVFDLDTLYGYDNGSASASGMARTGFVVKFEPDGDVVWANKFQGGDRCRGYGIAVDEIGQVYLTGVIEDLTSFDAVVAGEAGTDVFGFVAKYSVDGICIWADYFAGPYGSQGNDIQLLDNETLVVTGNFKSQLIFDGVTITGSSPTWPDYFLMQIDTAGSHIWSVKGIGSYFIQGLNSVVDSDDNIYIVGNFAGSMNLGDTTMVSLGTGATTTEINERLDSFVAKYDRYGNRIWIRQVGSELRTELSGITLLGDDYVIVSGYTEDTSVVAWDTLFPFNGWETGFILGYTTGGSYMWNKQVINSGSPTAASYNLLVGNTVYSVNADHNGNIFGGGLFSGIGTWDATSITCTTGHYGFLAKLFPPLNPSIEFEQLCLSVEMALTGNVYGAPLTYSWEATTNPVIYSDVDSLILSGDIAGFDSVTYIVSNGYETDTATLVFYLGGAPTVDLGSDTSTCEATLDINAGSDGVYYDWGSGPVAWDSILTVTSTGTYTVIVSDSNGCSAQDEILVTIKDCSGWLDDEQKLIIYPNPFYDLVHVGFVKELMNISSEVIIREVSGKTVYYSVMMPGETLNLSALSVGMYQIEFIFADKVIGPVPIVKSH